MLHSTMKNGAVVACSYHWPQSTHRLSHVTLLLCFCVRVREQCNQCIHSVQSKMDMVKALVTQEVAMANVKPFAS